MLRGLLDKVPVTTKPRIQEFANRARQNLENAHDSIIAARIQQTFHTNKRRREEPMYNPGDCCSNHSGLSVETQRQ